MYYIYEIWNLIDDIPIYVGYGKHNRKKSRERYEDHIFEAISYKENRRYNTSKLNMYKIHVLLQLLEQNKSIGYKFPFTQISYNDACKLEQELIEKYGRRINNTGTLTNLDSGGRGGKKLTIETRRKISESNKGQISPLKGRKIGPYSEKRKLAIQEGVLKYQETDRYQINLEKMKEKLRGRCLSDNHKEKISNTLKGRPSPMKGKEAWNKGKTKYTDERLSEMGKKMSIIKKGKTAWNKGKTTPHKGKTYEEIYGEEMAQKMREVRTLKCWITNGNETKKILKTELSDWINHGWTRGRSDNRK